MTSIRNRRGTAAQWASTNPVLSSGEFGVESDTFKVKVGNGVSTWIALPYVGTTSNGSDPNVIALGNKIGFVGDSYTSGYGLTNPTTERWSRLLADRVGATESNTAVPSSGYINQGSGGNSKFATQAGLLDANCSSVIMLGGINDAPLLSGTTPAAYQAEVLAAVNAVKARCPSARVIVISPMWHAGMPSSDLLLAESYIRKAIPSDVLFIERGPWIRIDRVEWQIFDGHPNALGASAIAAWVADQLGYNKTGAVYADIMPSGTSDVALNTTNFPAYTLGSTTIWDARSGWWRMKAQVVMYNAAVNGSIWITENNSRKITLRSDQVSTLPSPVHHMGIEFYHPGGNLTFKFGYDPNNTNMMVITNAKTRAEAKWLGPK